MNTLRLLLLPLLAAGTLGSAHATSSASATASNFTLTLIDLAPNDGIAPSLTWLPAQTEAAASSLRITDALSGEQVRLLGSHTAADLPLNLSRFSQNGQAGVQLNGTDLSSLTLGASAAFNGAGSLENRASATVASDRYAFTLSPYTALTITADVNVHATTTVGSLQPERWEGAGGSVRLELEQYHNGQFSSGYYPYTRVEAYFIDPQDLSKQEPLAGTVENRQATASTVYVTAYASAYGYSITSTVPEPSTWAMLLLGAALLPVAGARRRAAGARTARMW